MEVTEHLDIRPSATDSQRSAGARYLLRFDDLCPTMNWRIWDVVEDILVRHRINPILAIVPDNRDPKLVVDKANPEFWDRAREWQRRGWTIALHGYQHLYTSVNAGIVGRRKLSEFAGIPKQEQANKLREATGIFRRESIKSHVWVAPGHTFDENTVSLLPEFGLTIISDGIFRHPFCSHRVTWIPQQLWEFRSAPSGVWTICFHHNDWSEKAVRQFRDQVASYSNLLTRIENVLHRPGHLDVNRMLFKLPRCADVVMRAQLKLFSFGHQR
jgi:predicted deacetylase